MRFYYDLHIHSVLSPCGDDDMTPNNIVNMSLLNELNIIALSDHNTCGNVAVVSELAKKAGLVFLPAVEVETMEEIHVLCLFPSVDDALRFEEDILRPSLADIENDERIFGKQIIMDVNDEPVGTDKRYLINATTIDIDNIAVLVDNYNGVAVPAHIDKPTKSLISMLGMADRSMGFNTFELSKNAPKDYAQSEFSLKNENYCYIYDSDAHYLTDIFERGEHNFFEFDALPTPSQIIKFIKEGRI